MCMTKGLRGGQMPSGLVYEDISHGILVFAKASTEAIGCGERRPQHVGAHRLPSATDPRVIHTSHPKPPLHRLCLNEPPPLCSWLWISAHRITGGCAKVAEYPRRVRRSPAAARRAYKEDGHSRTEIDPCADGLNGGSHERAACKMTTPVSLSSHGKFGSSSDLAQSCFTLLTVQPLPQLPSHLSLCLVKSV
ncbi:Hypothetical predicted protein, partial [Lynx pardinus]